MEFKERISTLKSRISCFQLCQKIGIKVDSRHKINCVFHGEKTPSMQVYDNHFYCFGCGKQADVIAFIGHVKGLHFVESIEFLESGIGMAGMHARVDFPTFRDFRINPLTFQECMQNEEFKTRREIINFITEFLYEKTMQKIWSRKIPSKIAAWLNLRGFEISRLLIRFERCEVLFVLDVEEMTNLIKDKFASWEKTNLFMQNGLLKWFGIDYAVAFPISNEEGVTSMRLRNVNVKISKNSPKDIELPAIENLANGFGFMGYQQISNETIVYLTEGAPDMIAGFHLFTGENDIVMSTGNVKKMSFEHNLRLLKDCKRLVLCFDNDEVGDDTTLKVARAAKLLGIQNIAKFNLQGHKDLNDYLIQSNYPALAKAC